MWALASSSHIQLLFSHHSTTHTQTRDAISVMFDGQVMLALVLTVKTEQPVTLSKHEATHWKENKETGNDHTLTVSWMLWNFLEDSREFYCLAMDIKSQSHHRRRNELPASRTGQFWAQDSKLGFLHSEFKETTHSKKEYKRYLLDSLTFSCTQLDGNKVTIQQIYEDKPSSCWYKSPFNSIFTLLPGPLTLSGNTC